MDNKGGEGAKGGTWITSGSRKGREKKNLEERQTRSRTNLGKGSQMSKRGCGEHCHNRNVRKEVSLVVETGNKTVIGNVH